MLDVCNDNKKKYLSLNIIIMFCFSMRCWFIFHPWVQRPGKSLEPSKTQRIVRAETEFDDWVANGDDATYGIFLQIMIFIPPVDVLSCNCFSYCNRIHKIFIIKTNSRTWRVYVGIWVHKFHEILVNVFIPIYASGAQPNL